MTALFRQITDNLRAEIAKHRNRPYLEAAMAASASIAIADGEVSFSERHRVDAIVERLDELSIFDPHIAVDLFNDHVEALANDREAGWRRICEIVKRFAGKPEAESLVRIALAMSLADGDFSPPERARVQELCSVLALEPGQFEL